jgi:hypothetical protein
MDIYQKPRIASIINTIIFGIITYLIAIFIVPLFINDISRIWAITLAFVPGLLTIYHLIIPKEGIIFERRVYIGALIVGFIFWIAIRSAGYYSTTIEIIFPIVIFLLIYLGFKR